MDIDKLKRCIQKGLKDDVFPGYAVGISHGDFKNVFVGGYTSHKKQKKITNKTLFDLASLSKPLATTLACLVLIKEGVISYDMTLESLLDCAIPDDKKNINLSQLLSHSAGFIGHQDFYKNLEKYPLEQRKDILLQDILHLPLSYSPGSISLYSDIGFILLFFIVEFKTKINLEKFVEKRVFAPFGVKDICYKPKLKGYNSFAATEDCGWRKKEICGEVHDQNTSILSGVCGQAGLFSTIDSVLDLVTCLKDLVNGKIAHPYLDRKLLKEAVTRRLLPKGTCWGFGFDTPSQPGSSAGRFISEDSCGHLGFTGTSFWLDFKRDIAVVLLTNRINPSVDNLKIRDFRPEFHDIVFAPQVD